MDVLERQISHKSLAFFLRILADRVLYARLSSGIRVLDATDFKAWLLELAERAEAARTEELRN
jgi:hypothetical protein